MNGVTLAQTVPLTFVFAVTLLVLYSGLFLWFNRDRLVLAVPLAAGWSLAGLLVLVATAADSDHYWMVALALLGTIAMVGTVVSARIRRRVLRPRRSSTEGR